jgi:hypothetical protein
MQVISMNANKNIKKQTIMKRTFLPLFDTPNFESMHHDQFMSALRVYSAKLNEEREENKDNEVSSLGIPRSANLSNDSVLAGINNATDIKESAYEYFLSVRARKIIYDAIGKKCTNDIKRFKAQFPDDTELIKELEESTLNLPVVSSQDGNLLATPITDFSAFADAKEFEHYIDCSNKSVIEIIAEYVKFKAVSVKKSTLVCHYPSIVYYILKLEFLNNITLRPAVIGHFFMAQFEKYLRLHGLSTNTILSMINALKAVLKWGALYGARLAIDINGYKLKESDKKPKVSLTSEEICKIYYYDFTNLKISDQLKKTYERVRDHFILDCFLGQRFGDTPRITKNNFCGNAHDTFKITQQKTGNNVVLPFHKVYGEYPVIAREILEKYDYQAPFTGTMSTFNRRLHEICKYAGLTEDVKYETKINDVIVEKTFKKYELVSSHCARRTFVTNCVKRGLHSQRIKRASGHTSDKSFGKYVIWNDDIE